MTVLSADDLMNGVTAKGRVVIFDDDHYYMGHTFGYQEAGELLDGMGGEFQLKRFDPLHIYGELSKP